MHQQRSYHHNEILANQNAVYVSIRFGNPTTGDCRNFGICKMEVFDAPITEFQKENGYALAQFSIVNDKKQILFEKAFMTKASQEFYFGKGFFLIEAEVCIGEELSRRLEVKNASLKAGRYLVIETLTSYIIKI